MDAEDSVCDRNGLIVCQISRGMSPAVSIAQTVDACWAHGLKYKLITGLHAAEAKNEAARVAYDRGLDLILIEDDILIKTNDFWKRAIESKGVAVGSALLRDGTINTWFHDQRLAYAGTCFLKVSHTVLEAVGDPWFQPRDLWFSDEGGGVWVDDGDPGDGTKSDVWFFFRCWELKIWVEVLGSVIHLIHEYNNQRSRLQETNTIKPLGVVVSQKIKTRKEK